jgi:hypothetical protein
MSVPREVSQIATSLTSRFPALRPAQHLGLASWVTGTVLAGSGCEDAVIAALRPLGEGEAALRHRLRDWLADGADKAAPCSVELDVTNCFAPLVRWVLRWWRGAALPLAIDATTLADHVVVLAISVLYRGSAIPVAWPVVPGNVPGAWVPHLLTLLDTLAPAVPPTMRVVVFTDRGLWSNRLWDGSAAHGWHPVMRLQATTTFAPRGATRVGVKSLIPGAGHAWVGAGTAFKERPARRDGTLVIVWDAAQAEPWVVLTTLPPDQVGVVWYGLRAWIESGFRALKSMGWQWDRTRRTDPVRVARHWLVLAVATLWALAYGTRAEDADVAGVPPARLHAPRQPPPPTHRRAVSLLTRGIGQVRYQWLGTRRLWTRVWLVPQAWPRPDPALIVTRVLTPSSPGPP